MRGNMNVNFDNFECNTQSIQTKLLNERRRWNRLTWM
jgi:hypothetical protein